MSGEVIVSRTRCAAFDTLRIKRDGASVRLVFDHRKLGMEPKEVTDRLATLLHGLYELYGSSEQAGLRAKSETAPELPPGVESPFRLHFDAPGRPYFLHEAAVLYLEAAKVVKELGFPAEPKPEKRHHSRRA